MRREDACVFFLSHQIFINVMKVFIKNSASSLIEFFLVKEEDFKLEHTIFSIKIHSNTEEDKIMLQEDESDVVDFIAKCILN